MPRSNKARLRRAPTLGRRRALGQHFLRDKGIAQLIADTAIDLARKNGCRALLEIGPGRGAITEPLLELVSAETEIETFILSERDATFANEWTAKAPPKTRVEAGDFLDLPEDRWLSLTPLAVASNLPYSAGTAIATRLAKHPDKIPFMVLMFQAEVAQRLRAEVSTKDWGSLSVWIQNRWDVTRLCAVPPGAFVPPPQVNSEVVVLERRAQPRISIPIGAEAKWESLLRTCFAHRRKMLRSGLPPDSPQRNALALSGVDDTKRAEALQWDEWDRLFRALLQV